MARTLIGNIKGPKGDTGDTGATGATGAAGASASVSVGTVTALEYGNNPTVTNSGSAQNAVFNFGIPKGKPADNITELDNLPVNSSVTPSADFPVPAVGDTSKTILGKIIKWFGDMSALVATKFNAANVYNGLDKTESGYALDARQGKALNATKLNVANVVNNLTTTDSGYALDARQGKVLSDKTNTMFMGITTLERCSIHISDTISSGLVHLDFTFDSPLHITPSRLFIGMPQTSTMFVTAFALSATGGKLRLYNFGDAYQANDMVLIGIAMNP